MKRIVSSTCGLVGGEGGAGKKSREREEKERKREDRAEVKREAVCVRGRAHA